MDVEKFKRLAKTRLREGRLIKLSNEYSIDEKKRNDALSKSPKTDKELLEFLVLQNLIYIGFSEIFSMLMDAFSQFLKNNEKRPYVLAYKRDGNKSDVWIISLFMRYGRKFIKEYYDPVNIIDLSKTKNPPIDVDYVLCDDFIFSGTQMIYTLDMLHLKTNMLLFAKKKTIRTFVIVGGVTTTGFENVGNKCTRIFCSKQFKCFGDYVKKSHPEKYLDIKHAAEDEFGQPFIDKINYMSCIPIYFEHKMPDAMSSFPSIISKVISNCTWGEETNYEDGSGIDTLCAHPFYKKENYKKGEKDVKHERVFMKYLKSGKSGFNFKNKIVDI